ncbi:MAG: cytochrome C [Acidobacteria bacterium]|nr:cytochrome C [Acidobacteriota bacterium]
MRMRSAIALATLLVGVGAAVSAPGADSPSAVEAQRRAAGQTIYRSGILATGGPVRATVQGDVPLSGDQAACITCHRRSGFGSSEGRAIVRPVTGDALYKPVTLGLVGTANLWRSEGEGTRPGYTDETLARALRTGRDSSGRELDPLMPRYDLDDENVAALIAYLKTLSAFSSPGVDGSTLHFATIIADGVDPRGRQGLLDVMNAFFRDKNAGTRNEAGRKARGPAEMKREYGAYRTWKLHVWELHGAPATWGSQLDDHYRRQPVFAVLGGIAPGSWQPIHDACERLQVPCLFPITDEPVDAEDEFYTVYFTRGLPLEAAALARHLERTAKGRQRRVLQAYREGHDLGASPALRKALEGNTALALHDHAFPTSGPITAADWTSLLQRERPDVLVAWLRSADLEGLGQSQQELAGVEHVVLSVSVLADGVGAVPPAVRAKALLTSPFERPDLLDGRLTRTRGWLRSRKVAPGDDRVQIGTFYVLALTVEAMMELRGYFSRDYFVERIEHMVDGMLTSSMYPRLTLAPGARFASQGCFILRFDESEPAQLVTASDWIVP